MKTTCFIAGLLFVVSAVDYAQLVNEQLFPTMPYPGISAQILPAHDAFYISGLMSTSYPFFDGEQSSSIPFILLHPQTPEESVVLIPDTGHSTFYAFSNTHDEFAMNSIVDSNDSLFVAWSKMTHFDSDVPPTYYGAPSASVGEIVDQKVERVLSMANGLNPSIAVDESHTLDVVWQKVTPLSGKPGSAFETYRSTILYVTRNQAGQYSDTVVLGNGFFPQIQHDQNGLHCVYFGADSSSQTISYLVYQKINAGVTDPPVTLYEVPSSQNFSEGTLLNNIPLGQFVWKMDSLGGVHAGWTSLAYPTRIFVLHYYAPQGIQIDSTNSYYTAISNFRFMLDGEVRIFASTEDTYISPAILRYEISKQGISLREEQDIPLSSNSTTLGQVIIDTSGNQHVLVNDFSGPTKVYLIKNVGTADTSVNYLATSYTLSATSYVDKDNRVWLTGERSLTPVILNFLLNDVGKANDFEFPLTAGNVWYYGVVATENPDPLTSFIGYDSVTIAKDTVLNNGMVYVRLFSKWFGSEFLRKDGFRVFQYSLSDSMEYLRFNFSAVKGDTIAVYPTATYSNTMVLENTEMSPLFGLSRRTETYQGVLPGSRVFQAGVADSIGITKEGDGLSYEKSLVGAKINGVTYGTILGVNTQKQISPLKFSLSQNYPNPFNPTTNFQFTIGSFEPVTLKIFDILGREVATVIDQRLAPGEHSAKWDAGKFTSGVYFYQLKAGGFVQSKKMILLK